MKNRVINPEKVDAALADFFVHLMSTPMGVGYTVQALVVYTQMLLSGSDEEVPVLLPSTAGKEANVSDWKATAEQVKELLLEAMENSTEPLQ